MADQKDNFADPTGLDIILEDEVEAIETQGDVSEERREVDHLVHEDVTDHTEQHTAPLHVFVDNASADASEIDSQPRSAFSSSSSDEDSDVDDEGAGVDGEGNEFDQAEDWLGPNIDDVPPAPGAEPIFVAPRVYGMQHDDNDAGSLWRFSNRGDVPYHSESDSGSGGRRRKKTERNKGEVWPSPLRTASDPDSPVSPKNKKATTEIGVLPEPSPIAEDASVISPLSDHEETAEPESSLDQQFSSAKWDWSEEDEDDTSWVVDAVAAVKGPDTGSEDDSDRIPSPVSPLEGAEDELEADDQDDEYDDVISSEAQMQDLDESHEISEAPEGFNPTFVTVPDKYKDPTSPEPDGPDMFTGLSPQSGFNRWKEWHDQNERKGLPGLRFRSGYIITNDDGKSGDLDVNTTGDRSNAAEFLRKQRLLCKEKNASDYHTQGIVMAPPGSTCASCKSNHDNILEFLKLHMYKYRYQRNLFMYEFRRADTLLQDSIDRVGRRDETIQELNDRVGRRDETVRELDEMVDRREKTLEQQKANFEQLEANFEEVQSAWEGEKSKRKQLLDEMRVLKMFSEQYEKSAKQNAAKLRRYQAERNADFQMSTIMTTISQAPDAVTAGDDSELSTLKTRNEHLKSEIKRVSDEDERFIQQQSAGIRKLQTEFEKVIQDLAKTEEDKSALEKQVADNGRQQKKLQSQVDLLSKQLDDSQESCTTWHETSTELQSEVDELKEKLTVKDSEELNKSTNNDPQAEAEALRLQAQKKDELEDRLAASGSHSEYLESRRDGLEVELETSRMAKQANTASTSELSDRVEAAEEHARNKQLIIEDLEAELEAERGRLATSEATLGSANNDLGELGADLVAFQMEFDATVANFGAEQSTLQGELYAERQEVQTLRSEAMTLWDALLEHKTQFPASPLSSTSTVFPPSWKPKARASISSNPHRSSIRSSIGAISSPLHDIPEQQQQRKTAYSRPARWTSRENAIIHQKNAANDLKSRHMAREKRQAVELERLDQIEQRMGSLWGVTRLPYVPLEGRFLAMKV